MMSVISILIFVIMCVHVKYPFMLESIARVRIRWLFDFIHKIPSRGYITNSDFISKKSPADTPLMSSDNAESRHAALLKDHLV